MIKTNCEINGETFKLKYQKAHTIEGKSFQGILFLFKKAVGFSYLRRKDNTIEFDPQHFDLERRKGIINAIDREEQDKQRY